MPSTYEFIQKTTTTGGETSVTFSGISQSYTDLIVVSNMSFTTNSLDYRLNLGNGFIDTGVSYSSTYTVAGTSASASITGDTSYIAGYRVVGGGTNMQVAIHQIQSYSNPSVFKNVLLRVNDASAEIVAGIGVWRSTSVVNTLRLTTTGTLASGSSITIYGIKAA